MKLSFILHYILGAKATCFATGTYAMKRKNKDKLLLGAKHYGRSVYAVTSFYKSDLDTRKIAVHHSWFVHLLPTYALVFSWVPTDVYGLHPGCSQSLPAAAHLQPGPDPPVHQ